MVSLRWGCFVGSWWALFLFLFLPVYLPNDARSWVLAERPLVVLLYLYCSFHCLARALPIPLHLYR